MDNCSRTKDNYFVASEWGVNIWNSPCEAHCHFHSTLKSEMEFHWVQVTLWETCFHVLSEQNLSPFLAVLEPHLELLLIPQCHATASLFSSYFPFYSYHIFSQRSASWFGGLSCKMEYHCIFYAVVWMNGLNGYSVTKSRRILWASCLVYSGINQCDFHYRFTRGHVLRGKLLYLTRR